MDFIVNGINYKAGTLPAIKQFHVIRRCAPLLAGIADKNKALEGIFNAIGTLKDDDAEFILFGLLSCVEREQTGIGWAKITTSTGNSLMFQDIDLAAMMQIAFKAFQANFQGFLAALPSDFNAVK